MLSLRKHLHPYRNLLHLPDLRNHYRLLGPGTQTGV